jgi:hypothetical protein
MTPEKKAAATAKAMQTRAANKAKALAAKAAEEAAAKAQETQKPQPVSPGQRRAAS